MGTRPVTAAKTSCGDCHRRLERINECRGRQVGLVGRRCSAAEAAQQRGPTVYPATVFVKPLSAENLELIELEGCFLTEPEKRIAARSGFKAISHKLEFFRDLPGVPINPVQSKKKPRSRAAHSFILGKILHTSSSSQSPRCRYSLTFLRS